MIIEQRTYLLKAGALDNFLEVYQNYGIEVQTRTLGNMIGYFYSDIGRLNEVVHLWGYEGLDERRRRRDALARTEEWRRYLDNVHPLIIEMNSKILHPTPFSPIR